MKLSTRNLKQNKSLNLISIILLQCFFVVALFSASVSYANYTAQQSILQISRVAKFVINVSETTGITNATDLLYRGENAEYYFSVTNTMENITSEVVIDYFIEIQTNENYIDEIDTNSYKLYQIGIDGVTRTLVPLINAKTIDAKTLGIPTVYPDNSVEISQDTQNYVLVYYPISTTNGSTPELLFSINITAYQA